MGLSRNWIFAATSRYGVPKDLMYLIDRLHQAGIGVLIDWVLGHINRDEHGLYFFDGTPLYEIEDDFQRENIVWGTANLDFSKGPTKSFMLSALSFWVKYFHIDGFRIDAVSNLYHHHGNPEHGENKPAIDFLKQLSHHLFGLDDRLLFMAEDSSAHPDVTKPVDAGGVGFNYKWNMGFMNDTLNYFKKIQYIASGITIILRLELLMRFLNSLFFRTHTMKLFTERFDVNENARRLFPKIR